ncbi:DsbA family protein [Limimaricola cinnabarinus]|jgi:protein-disulfide isomerase|uniref:Disulfide bond formation protein DsbA n=1 Tax=Limimaricola cinnabarinus TaxID=1125964 RepID=A0A2G1MF35_9RHOB|nr:DsbA family protein [Limimaricola cinnabarinus]PHP27355.1 disulfide bond formation protein DsbA [Limimaricola cinnabarinus]
MLRSLIRALPVTLALAGPAAALDLDAMSEGEREAFGAQVRAYLLENPEVLMEAIAVLDQRQAEAAAQGDSAMIAAYSDALFDYEGDWQGGNPDGDITVVEFMDYKCGYCRRAFPEVEELVESDGNIRYILKEFPILGEQSLMASQFALAVRALEGDAAYKQAHNALMTMRSDVTEESLKALADSLDADFEAVQQEMESPEVARVIAENRQLAQAMQVSGTPSFVMGEQMLRGYVPLAQMREIVSAERGE